MLVALFLLNLVLSINPTIAFAPVRITATFRFDQPVLGEVCLQAVAVSDDATIFYRETCEGINGTVRQLRWNWPWSGTYEFRGVYRGGTETIITPAQRISIKPPLGAS